MCVCVCVRSQFNTLHCSRSCSSRDGEGGEGYGEEGRRCLMWVGNAFHLIAQLLHVLRVPQPTVHTVHAPKTTQVTTLAYFSAQAATHANHNARASTYSPATPLPPPPPLYHPLIQLCKMLLISLRWQKGGREREREGECLQNFRVLYVICDFSS